MADRINEVESLWPDYPNYRIDLTPCQLTGQVWAGDTLLAESNACLIVTETDHDDRLYFPESSVQWEYFEESEHNTVCPFKGRACYWNFIAPNQTSANAVWTYRAPMPEVAGLQGYVSFYDRDLRIVVVDQWPDGTKVASTFPLWGDAAELLRLIDVEHVDDGKFIGPAHGPTRRDVIEGGQFVGEAVVAASKTHPGQRITSVSMIFTKAASFTAPVDIDVDVLRNGRTFSTTEVRISQNGALRSVGLLLADSGADDLIRETAPMPDTPGPEGAVQFAGFGMPGREIRVVDAAYDPDPERLGPPAIDAWIRFRDSPNEQYLHQALLAQSTTHWTIAAGMRPHRGFGEARAHDTLSTGIMKATIAFHDDVDISDWLLYSNRAFWSGRGLVQGDGLVYTREGRLAASYTIQAMVRAFDRSPTEMGHDSRTAM